MRSFIAAVAAVAVQGAESYGYGYGHPHYHTQTSSSYDPWTTTSTATSTTGWYSPYQQYSPPKIAYKGGSSKVTEFATCQAFPSPFNAIIIVKNTAATDTTSTTRNVAAYGDGNVAVPVATLAAATALLNTQTNAAISAGQDKGAFAVDSSMLIADIQFAQAPGKTTSMNIKFFQYEGVLSTATTVASGSSYPYSYEFRLQEYGNLRAATASTATTVGNAC